MPIPVLRAETYYVPASRPGRPVEDWSQVPGAELAFRWINQRLNRRTPVPIEWVPDAAPVYARVDDNRWLAQCDTCRTAVLVSLVDTRFGCTECLRDWVPLIVPEDVAAIDAEMMVLPPHPRFWWHPDDPTSPYRPEPQPEEPPAEPEPGEQP